jgi:hypothetical protein
MKLGVSFFLCAYISRNPVNAPGCKQLTARSTDPKLIGTDDRQWWPLRLTGLLVRAELFSLRCSGMPLGPALDYERHGASPHSSSDDMNSILPMSCRESVTASEFNAGRTRAAGGAGTVYTLPMRHHFQVPQHFHRAE